MTSTSQHRTCWAEPATSTLASNYKHFTSNVGTPLRARHRMDMPWRQVQGMPSLKATHIFSRRDSQAPVVRSDRSPAAPSGVSTDRFKLFQSSNTFWAIDTVDTSVLELKTKGVALRPPQPDFIRTRLPRAPRFESKAALLSR